YFIVIDDVWEVSSWNAIRIALQDKNLGSKIIITTRRSDVAELVHCSYQMKPLSSDSSKELFYGRIFGTEDKCPEKAPWRQAKDEDMTSTRKEERGSPEKRGELVGEFAGLGRERGEMWWRARV
ncbi:hypothetical protein EJB05_14532, partial [Eragrostis curvula]